LGHADNWIIRFFFLLFFFFFGFRRDWMTANSRRAQRKISEISSLSIPKIEIVRRRIRRAAGGPNFALRLGPTTVSSTITVFRCADGAGRWTLGYDKLGARQSAGFDRPAVRLFPGFICLGDSSTPPAVFFFLAC